MPPARSITAAAVERMGRAGERPIRLPVAELVR